MKKLVVFLIMLLVLPSALAAPSPPQLTFRELKQFGIGGIRQIAVSPNDMFIAGAGNTGLWIYDAQSFQLIEFMEEETTIFSVAWSPDSQTLAFTDGILIKTLNVETGNLSILVEKATSPIATVVWSPDGQYLATGSYDIHETDRYIETDPYILVWDASSGELVWTLIGHTANVSELAWSPNSKLLASATSLNPNSNDPSIRIWDMETGQAAAVLNEREEVAALSWSPDGNFLATAGYDGALRIWDTQTSQIIQDVNSSGLFFTAVAWSSDSQYIAAADTNNVIYIFDSTNLSHAKCELKRP